MPGPRSISTLNRRSSFKSTASERQHSPSQVSHSLSVVKPLSAQARPSLNSTDIARVNIGRWLFSVADYQKAEALHVWSVGIATLCRKPENTTQTRLPEPHTITSKQESCNMEMLALKKPIRAVRFVHVNSRHFMSIADQHRFRLRQCSTMSPPHIFSQ